MPSFVYACEECQSEIRHIITSLLNNSFTDNSLKCKIVKKFTFLRDGNMGEDWYSKISIKNKRRRSGDDSYNSDDVRGDDDAEDDVKISA